GLVPKAAWTLLVSIGLPNCRTIAEYVGTLLASWAGELLTTTGSRGRQSVCATKIFALVPGTVMGGISGVVVTVRTSLVSYRLRIFAPGAKVVERLVKTWVEVAVLNTTKTSWVPPRRRAYANKPGLSGSYHLFT